MRKRNRAARRRRYDFHRLRNDDGADGEPPASEPPPDRRLLRPQHSRASGPPFERAVDPAGRALQRVVGLVRGRGRFERAFSARDQQSLPLGGGRARDARRHVLRIFTRSRSSRPRSPWPWKSTCSSMRRSLARSRRRRSPGSTNSTPSPCLPPPIPARRWSGSGSACWSLEARSGGRKPQIPVPLVDSISLRRSDQPRTRPYADIDTAADVWLSKVSL